MVAANCKMNKDQTRGDFLLDVRLDRFSVYSHLLPLTRGPRLMRVDPFKGASKVEEEVTFGQLRYVIQLAVVTRK